MDGTERHGEQTNLSYRFGEAVSHWAVHFFARSIISSPQGEWWLPQLRFDGIPTSLGAPPLIQRPFQPNPSSIKHVY